MLSPLPIDLEELAGALDGEPDYRSGRVNLETAEVLYPASVDYLYETGELDPDDDDDQDSRLFVESQGSLEGCRDREDFIGTVLDDHRAELLEVAIQGRGAFGRFKNTLSRWPDDLDRWYAWPDDLDRWYAFSNARQRGRARAWLAAEGYQPQPRSEPLPGS